MGEAQYVWVLIKNNTFDMPMQYVSSIFNLEDKTRVELLEISYDFERAQDRTHNSDTFSCSESSTSGNLKRHERTYSGDKPFSCSQCDNKYSISSHLKRHERTHTVMNHLAAPIVTRQLIKVKIKSKLKAEFKLRS